MSTNPQNTLEDKDALDKSKSSVVKKYVEKDPRKLTLKGKIDRGIYMEWLSIPRMVRKMTDQEREELGYESDDPVFNKLLTIKTKGEFCKLFGVDVNMPARWEKNPEFIEEFNTMSRDNHVLKFRNDVDFSFTQKVIKYGDAQRMKLWKQLNEGWTEKTEVNNTHLHLTPADFVKSIEDRNKALRANQVVHEAKEVTEEK